MTKMTDTAAAAAIGAATRELRLPVIRADAGRLAEIAQRSQQSYLAFLAEVLSAEVDERSERRRQRRVTEARFPRAKRLGDFDLNAAPTINPATIATLATCAYLDAGEPVVLLGDSGTGKSHLLIGLGIAACEQGRRVRYATAAQLAHALRRLAPELSGVAPMEPLTPGSRLLQSVHREPEPVPARPAPARPAPARRPVISEPAPPPPPPPPPPPRRPERRPTSNVRLVAVAAGALAVAVVAVLMVRAVASGDGTQAGSGNATRPASQRGNTTATDAKVTGPPPAAQPATVDGAAVYVNYWVATLNRAVSSGDTTLLEAASSPNCKACAAVVQVMRAGYTGGTTFRGGTYTVREVTTDAFFNLERPSLNVVFDRAPRSSIAADGRQVQVFPGGTFLTCRVLLERVQDRWRVLDVQATAPIA